MSSEVYKYVIVANRVETRTKTGEVDYLYTTKESMIRMAPTKEVYDAVMSANLPGTLILSFDTMEECGKYLVENTIPIHPAYLRYVNTNRSPVDDEFNFILKNESGVMAFAEIVMELYLLSPKLNEELTKPTGAKSSEVNKQTKPSYEVDGNVISLNHTNRTLH